MRFGFQRRRPDRLHVRLHVLHQGADSGDMTVEGWEVGGDAHWIFLDRARILADDGSSAAVAQLDVPRGRVLLRERLISVSSPLLDGAMLIGSGE